MSFTWSSRLSPAASRIRSWPIGALIVVAAVLLMSFLADILSPHSPHAPSLVNRLKPPAWSAGGSSEFLLGTDSLGRDVLSRLIHGSRVSVVVGLGTVMLSGLVGLAVGLVSGFLGGKVDTILMRLVDMMLAIPSLLIVILFAVALEPSLMNVIIALSIVLWSRFARVVRGDALALREREFVVAAHVVGAGPLRIMALHILPNLFNTWLIVLSVQLGWAILSEASLSFLGAGVPAPSVSWGAMVSQGRNYIDSAWWISFFPGLAIILLVMSVNIIGDWLRNLIDPRMQHTAPSG